MTAEALLVWTATLVLSLAIWVPYGVRFRRRLRRDRERLEEARRLGGGEMALQFPHVDATRCIGCATCVGACPEDVLGVVGGVAVVIHALQCVGHGRCEDACPVGAIEVGLGDVKGRADVPRLDEHFETSVPGVFVAGELSGLALVSRAVAQGAAAVGRIADRSGGRRDAAGDGSFDVVIVGAGPAGLAAALEARARGLSAVVLEQEAALGGSLLHFPRRKLVLTQPVDLPRGVRLDREEYSKEELLAFFQGLLERHRLTVRFGERVSDIQRGPEGLRVISANAVFRARNVVLALGRRGTPRRLGVPGEELPKVMYQLRDAESYAGRRVLVVGGGDSAVEAAIGLARQPGSRVTLSYRGEALVRVKKKNRDAFAALGASGRLAAFFGSRVEAIGDREVTLRLGPTAGEPARAVRVENEAVFVMIGGEPPFPLLRQIGIRFGGDEVAPADPEARGVVRRGGEA